MGSAGPFALPLVCALVVAPPAARADSCDQLAVSGERVEAQPRVGATVEHRGIRFALRAFVRRRAGDQFAVEWQLTIRNHDSPPYPLPCPFWSHEQVVGGGMRGGPWPAPSACWNVTLARGQQTVLHIAQPDSCGEGVARGQSVAMELGLDDGDVAVPLAAATLTVPPEGPPRLRLRAPPAAHRKRAL